MDTGTSRKEFYQGAMSKGTILGIVWSIMYLLLFAGTGNILLLSASMTLFIASPFIAARQATDFRRKECGNAMPYLQAWIFLFYMYICATLLSTLVSYIYFRFIDGGTFFMTIQSMFDETMKIAGSDETLMQQMEQTKAFLDRLTTKEFVWQLMNNNLTNALVMPLIIAFFVKKKKE